MYPLVLFSIVNYPILHATNDKMEWIRTRPRLNLIDLNPCSLQLGSMEEISTVVCDGDELWQTCCVCLVKDSAVYQRVSGAHTLTVCHTIWC